MGEVRAREIWNAASYRRFKTLADCIGINNHARDAPQESEIPKAATSRRTPENRRSED
ncbi:MAG: hypothetical protein L0211_09800 [Planctomycetaceae bacterium]|nr:hypothetical protein [Planctomycetaceae bacterium]